MPTPAELGKLVKQRYPGAYDDVDDSQLGNAVKQRYPGAYDDFADAPRTLAGQAKEFGKGAAAAIPEGIIQTLRGVSGISDDALNMAGAMGGPLAAMALLAKGGKEAYQPTKEAYAGSAYQKAMEAAPGYEDSYARMGGQVVGSAIPMLAASAVAGPIPATMMAMSQGAGQQGENIDQQRAQGKQISAGQEALATGIGSLIGATEMLPLSRIAGPLNRVLQRGIGSVAAKATGRPVEEAAKRGVSAFIASMGTQAAEEGLQEGGSQLLNNLTEQKIYNPERGTWDNVATSAIAGAFGGAAIDATIGHLARRIEQNQLKPKEEPTRYREQVKPENPGENQRFVDAPSELAYPVTPQQSDVRAGRSQEPSPAAVATQILLDRSPAVSPSAEETTLPAAPPGVRQRLDQQPESSQPKVTRQKKQQVEIPETGVDERILRVQDARERIATQVIGKPWEQLANSERIAIDELINEGYRGAVGEPMYSRKLTAPTIAEPQVAWQPLGRDSEMAARLAADPVRQARARMESRASTIPAGPATNVQSEAPVDPGAIAPVSVGSSSLATEGGQGIPAIQDASERASTARIPASAQVLKPQAGTEGKIGDVRNGSQTENSDLDSGAAAEAIQKGKSTLTESVESTQPQSIEQWKAQAAPIARKLRGFADKVGAKDLYVRVIDRIHDRVQGKPVDEAAGQFDRGLVQVAYTGTEQPHDLAGTMSHEITHGFREMGLYTEPEWKVLSKKARESGVLDAIKADENYGKLSPEAQVEEAVARQFEQYMANELNPTGQQRGLFNRATNFLNRMHSGFKGQGFLTAQDVLTRFDQGDIGRRNRANGVEVGVPNGNIKSVNAQPDRPEQAQGQAESSGVNVREDLPETLIPQEAYVATEPENGPKYSLRDIPSSTPQAKRIRYVPDAEMERASKSKMEALRELEGQPGVELTAPNGKRDRFREIVYRDDKGKPQAYLSFYLDDNLQKVAPKDHGLFPEVWVEPAARRQGVASKLYDEAARLGYDLSEVSGSETTRAGAAFVEARKLKSANSKLLAITDNAEGTGRRKDIATMRAESGLSPAEFDAAFADLVKQDRIQAQKGGMSAADMVKQGLVEEGNYVTAPDGKPYLTASLTDAKPLYSRPLNKNANAAARAISEKTPLFADPLEKPGLGRKIIDIVSKSDERKAAIRAFRQEAFDSRARIAESDRLRAKGDVDLFADQAAGAAAYFADRSSNLTAASLKNGAPIYNKGFFKVSNVDKNGKPVKGLMEIFRPLMDSEILSDFFHYQAAIRGEELMADGRERRLSQQEIDAYKELGNDFPEIKTASREFKTWNDAFVDALADSGRISKATAADWKSRPYLPFYRIANDLDANGPGTKQTIGGPKTLQKLKGGTEQIADPLENIVRNMMSLTDIAMKNVAAQRAIRNSLELGWARPAQKSDTNTVTVYKDGKALKFAVDDKLMYEAMTATDIPMPALFEMLRVPAQVLREMVTKSPVFMARNLARDTMDIFAKGGFNLIPFVSTMDGALQAYTESQHYKDLENTGVVGGALLEGGAAGTRSRIDREMRKQQGYHNRMREFWDKFSEWSEKSEAANRIKVYEDSLKQHGNEAQAAFEALEVMNFSRRGNSQALRMATALIPFLNARLQGVDLLGRHLAGHAYGFDAKNGGRGAQVQKQVITRGLMVAAGTILYLTAISANKAWQQATPQERDDNWFIPLDDETTLKMPIPFELGTIFKTFPERLWANAVMGIDRNDQTVDALKRAAVNNLAQPMIPQAIKPAVENYFNHSMFKGGEIENSQHQQLLPEERWDEYTSQMARSIGKATGTSPLMVDNLLRGYFGTIGQFALGLTDKLLRPESQGEKADYAIWNRPMVGTLFQRPDGAGKIIDFYQFHQKLEQTAKTLKQLEQFGDAKQLKQFVETHQKELALQPSAASISKAMSELTKMDRLVLNSPTMTGEQKRKMTDEIRKRKSALAAQGVELRKAVQ